MKLFFIRFFTLVGLVFTYPAAWAASLPSNADVGRQPLPEAPRIYAPSVEAPSRLVSESPDLPPELAQSRFTLHSVRFEGVSAFPLTALEAPFAALVHKEITVSELFDAVTAVQQIYLDAYYTLSRVQIPEQDLSQGNVTIRVVEGYAQEVSLEPELQGSALAQDVAAEILAMRPLNAQRLERLMMVLSARPGLEAAAVLAPLEQGGDVNAGPIHIILQSRAQTKTSGYVELDNYGSYYLGPWRGRVGLRQGRVLGTDADFGVALSITPGHNELRQISFDTTMPVLGASGSLLRVYGGRSLTRPGEDLEDLDVKGASDVLGLSITYPLILQRDRQWDVDLAFDYQNIATNLLGDRIFDDRLRTVTLGTSYSLYDGLRGSTSFALSYRQGLDILGTRTSGADNLSRVDGKSDFRKVFGAASRLQNLVGALDMLFTVEGQYAWDPLLSSEEFGYGGVSMGRAYDSSELVGDRGVAASAELRYTVQPAALPQIILQPFVFYDIGKVWNIDPGAHSHASGTSAGAGVRFSLPWGTSGSLTAAVPLTRKLDNPPKYSSDSGPRILFSLQKSF